MRTFTEVERKFLIDVSKIDLTVLRNKKITQGYMITAPEGNVRVRIEERNGQTRAWLVIKLQKSSSINDEVTFEIDETQATELLQKCRRPYIEKVPYALQIENLKWEIDEFHGHKQGLYLAEVELQHLTEEQMSNIKLPDWIDREVTGIDEYYNANMI